jgi:hypothetical protein
MAIIDKGDKDEANILIKERNHINSGFSSSSLI